MAPQPPSRCFAALRLSLALALLGPALVSPPAFAQADPGTVKGAFLQRFASFVRRPPAAAPTPEPLCVIGGRAVLQRVASGATRAPQPRLLDSPEAARDCEVVYLAGAEQEVRQALRAVYARPVLTVTDQDYTPDVRGVVHFVIVNNRVRFHIDDALAAEHGLDIDSRLLNLALSVQRRSQR